MCTFKCRCYAEIHPLHPACWPQPQTLVLWSYIKRGLNIFTSETVFDSKAQLCFCIAKTKHERVDEMVRWSDGVCQFMLQWTVVCSLCNFPLIFTPLELVRKSLVRIMTRNHFTCARNCQETHYEPAIRKTDQILHLSLCLNGSIWGYLTRLFTLNRFFTKS